MNKCRTNHNVKACTSYFDVLKPDNVFFSAFFSLSISLSPFPAASPPMFSLKILLLPVFFWPCYKSYPSVLQSLLSAFYTTSSISIYLFISLQLSSISLPHLPPYLSLILSLPLSLILFLPCYHLFPPLSLSPSFSFPFYHVFPPLSLILSFPCYNLFPPLSLSPSFSLFLSPSFSFSLVIVPFLLSPSLPHSLSPLLSPCSSSLHCSLSLSLPRYLPVPLLSLVLSLLSSSRCL